MILVAFVYHRSESLEVGDRILAINGKTTDNLSHADVVTLLKDAEDAVTLEVEYETSTDGMVYVVLLKAKPFCWSVYS